MKTSPSLGMLLAAVLFAPLGSLAAAQGTAPATTAMPDAAAGNASTGAAAAAAAAAHPLPATPNAPMGGTTAAAPTPAATVDPSGVLPPRDAQIAGIVTAANKGEIDAGKLASSKAKNKSVKAFAEDMVKAHKAMQADTDKLLSKTHIKKENSPTSADLTKHGKDELDQLKKAKKGDDFDKHYIDAQVADHQTVLDSIDKVLLPAVKNPDMKALLEKARPEVAAHLEHAKKVQAELAGAHS